MRTISYNGVMYTITEEEYQGLVNGWLSFSDPFD